MIKGDGFLSFIVFYKTDSRIWCTSLFRKIIQIYLIKYDKKYSSGFGNTFVYLCNLCLRFLRASLRLFDFGEVLGTVSLLNDLICRSINPKGCFLNLHEVERK